MLKVNWTELVSNEEILTINEKWCITNTTQNRYKNKLDCLLFWGEIICQEMDWKTMWKKKGQDEYHHTEGHLCDGMKRVTSVKVKWIQLNHGLA